MIYEQCLPIMVPSICTETGRQGANPGSPVDLLRGLHHLSVPPSFSLRQNEANDSRYTQGVGRIKGVNPYEVLRSGQGAF